MDLGHLYSRKCLELKLEQPSHPYEFEGLLVEVPKKPAPLLLRYLAKLVRKAWSNWANVHRSL